MATTKIWKVQKRIDKVISYATNEEKTKNNISDGTLKKLLENKSILGIPLILYMVLALNISIEEEGSIVDVYDKIIDGSKEEFDMVLTLFPCLLAMILGVNLFTKSGLLPFLLQWFDPIFKILKVPSEIFPMALMRPISGSSTLALLNNVFTNYFNIITYITKLFKRTKSSQALAGFSKFIA